MCSRRTVSWCLLATAIIASAATPVRAAEPRAASTTDRALEKKVDAYLAPYLGLDVFQGAILIARGDQVVLQKGYGLANVELGVPNTPERVFRIASLSKFFTEVALGRLFEQRRLDPEAPLSRYIPTFPQGDRITIEMLRTHRAGIAHRNSIPFDEEGSGPNTLDSLVRAIGREPLAFEPGSKRQYSNGGYALLAFVIQQVTGESYASYLEREVLLPLGLRDTRHEADLMVVPNRAYGYMPRPDDPHGLMLAPYQEMGTKTGGGSLVSTVGDLHRFLRAAYQDNVISTSEWSRLFPSDDSTFGGQGRCPGYNVYMIRDLRQDVDAVVLANNYGAGMVGTIGSDLVKLARGLTPETPPWRTDVSADTAAAAAWIGGYRAASGALPYGEGPFTFERRGEGLVMLREGVIADYLIPQGKDRFLLRLLWSELRVERDSSGKAPVPTLRPLWFNGDPVKLTRL